MAGKCPYGDECKKKFCALTYENGDGLEYNTHLFPV